jgi:hypothetical protein
VAAAAVAEPALVAEPAAAAEAAAAADVAAAAEAAAAVAAAEAAAEEAAAAEAAAAEAAAVEAAEAAAAAAVAAAAAAVVPPPPPPPPLAAHVLEDLARSFFKPAYDAAIFPEYQDELLAAVRKMVLGYENRHNKPHAAIMDFFGRLQREWILDEPINVSAQKVWTSQENLDGVEFCSIYGETIREDSAALAGPSAVLARALNANLVTRGLPLADQPFPRGPGGGARDKSTEAGACWRGGGFMDNATTRAFYVPGRNYRVAQFLPTSFERPVAEQFIRRVELGQPANAYVLWKVRLDPDLGCDHVNLVTATHVPGESEFLFAAFSAFTVVVVNWSATPQHCATPHEITIRAAADNRNDPRFPETLALAPWC